MSLNLLEKLPSTETRIRQNRLKTSCRILGVIAATILVESLITHNLMSVIRPNTVLALIVYAGFGIIASGFFLVAIFLALPSFSVAARVTGAITGFAFLETALIFGALTDGIALKMLINYMTFPPILVLAMSLPLVIVRVTMGWQIHFPLFLKPNNFPHLSISEMMLLTTLAAVCFGILNYGPPESFSFGLISSVFAAGAGCFLALLIGMVFLTERYFLWSFVVGASVFGISTVIFYQFTFGLWESAGMGFGVLACYLSVALTLAVVRFGQGQLLGRVNYSATENGGLERDWR